MLFYGADETRTRHFQIANLTLYQMSYGPVSDGYISRKNKP